jgi:hypothetical protein
MDINTAPMYTINNRKSIQSAKQVGCYHCLTTFESNLVKQYTDKETTAICPYCGVDCLLPSVDLATLKKINEHWLH